MTATDHAARVWAMMTRADDPMPVAVAVDHLRELMDTDDLRAVFLAACGAAGEYLRSVDPRPEDDATFAHEVRDHVHDHRWYAAQQEVESLRTNLDGVWKFAPGVGQWLNFCDRARATIVLLREIESLTTVPN